MDASIFNTLNPKQREAVKAVEGPSVILAGAGSGKTRVLIHKVLNLIVNHQVLPSSIVMITFTNKAANEMKQRIARATTFMGNVTLGFVGTFHSFCCLILRRHGQHIGLDNSFTIYDSDDQQTVIKSILKTKEKTKYTPSYFSYRISEAKNQLISPERYLDTFSFYNAAQVAEVYSAYQKELEKNKAVDFDDLLMKAVHLFSQHPEVLKLYHGRYRHLMVDEFQDTNYAQYVLTQLLGRESQNLTVVGDFSQSIYSWRGAEIRNLEKVEQDFPGAQVIHLEENYRSTQTILDYAYDIISQNQMHPVLHLHTQNPRGQEITFFEAENEQEESIYIVNQIEKLDDISSYADVAVLYRTNAQSRVLEEAFLHYSIPYRLIGGTRFYERKEVKDVLAYLRLCVNPEDTTATQRVKKLGKRRWDKFRTVYQDFQEKLKDISTAELMEQIFQKTGYLELYNPDTQEDYARLENIRELKSVALQFTNLVQFLEQVALVESEFAEKEKQTSSKEGVYLMTLHQAKGLEFPHVFITGLEEGILPHSRSLDDTAKLEEERRLYYVGITRAQKKLSITYTRMRSIFGRRTYAVPSQFLGTKDRGRDSDEDIYF